MAVNSETGYERQNLPEPTDCLWILQPSHVTRSHKNANVKRYAVATLPRTDGVIAHKWHTTRTGKPGRSAQTYFSFPSPAPLPNAHAHEEKLRLACETKVTDCHNIITVEISLVGKCLLFIDITAGHQEVEVRGILHALWTVHTRAKIC